MEDQTNIESENNQEASSTPFTNRIDLTGLEKLVAAVRAEIRKVIIGQDEFIDLLICGLLANGHVLVEGVPGVAKTLTVRILAKTVDTDFSRIQFTPDLMPADIIGTTIFNSKPQILNLNKVQFFQIWF